MEQTNKELLLKDLCARLPYEVKGIRTYRPREIVTLNEIIPRCKMNPNVGNGSFCELGFDKISDCCTITEFTPYLFPLSSMTEEKAKELSILYGIKDILSINITDEYIDFKVDDGFCSFERKTIWYNEIISSTETFDWLNKNHFDYRGLIKKGLAIDATGLNIY